jgi:hypothetical protein
VAAGAVAVGAVEVLEDGVAESFPASAELTGPPPPAGVTGVAVAGRLVLAVGDVVAVPGVGWAVGNGAAGAEVPPVGTGDAAGVAVRTGTGCFPAGDGVGDESVAARCPPPLGLAG